MEQGRLDTLQNSVDALNNTTLAFRPGTRYQYGNENYNILGRVIEIVTGQSYGVFMEEHILRPLGLYSTYVNRNEAYRTGRFAQGYRRQFVFFTHKTESFGDVGNAPTGRLISSTHDLGRWMGIHMGLIDNIPDIFKKIIQRAHEPGNSVASRNGDFYAAGWIVSADRTTIAHGGNTFGFNSYALLFLQEQVAIAVLANISQANTRNVANNIKNVLDGNSAQAYRLDMMRFLDILFTLAIVISVPLSFVFFFLGIRRKNQKDKILITRRKFIITILGCFIPPIGIYFIPRIVPGFGGSWEFVLAIASHSILIGAVALVLLDASYAWFKLSKTTTMGR